MTTPYQNIVHIANDLRLTDPKRSLAILANLRSIVAQGQEQSPDQGAAPAAPPAPVAQAPGAEGGKPDIEDLKSKSKSLADAKTIEDFLSSLQGIHDSLSKTASTRLATGPGDVLEFKSIAKKFDMPELSSLEDMSDEEVQAFLRDQKSHAEHLEHATDLDSFMKGFDDMMGGVEESAKKVKTSSVRVKLSTLVRLASSNPEAAKVLMPILVAAKKKMDKKKPAKTSQKKDDKKDEKEDPKKKGNPFAKGDKKDDKKGPKGKAPPFGGKKAPPFGGKKPADKTSKKRKASVDASDTEW